MPPKKVVTPKRTLLNYFQVKQDTENLSPNKATPEIKEEDEDSDEEVKVSRKRSRIIINSDSDNEESSTPKKKSNYKKTRIASDDEETDKSVKRSKGEINLLDFHTSSTTSIDRLKKEIPSSKITSKSVPTVGTTKWAHEELEFLQPDKIRDINKNRPSHPEYDPRTLYVPQDFLNGLTPAIRQWWVLKSQHFDTVLFFKVGKFYELYHMDAPIGVKHLGFTFMKGDFAHTGFPESAYGRMAATLIELGYKVARVEQTETPEMMADRCKERKVTKFDKVVKREICQISTKGTCVYGAQLTDATSSASKYMLAITEKVDGDLVYGVCFIDVSIGTFVLGQFVDNKHNARLLTLIAQYPPSLLIIERGNLRDSTIEHIKKTTGTIRIEVLTPGTQFYNLSEVEKCLKEGCYFKDENNELKLPSTLQNILSQKNNFENALKALGGCIWYLKYSELDIQVISMGQFEIFEAIDLENPKHKGNMILDSITIENLKLLGGRGTLQKTLDYCQTAFGKRLLQRWICKPLCEADKIRKRQEAIKELYDNLSMLQNARDVLEKMPDLERQIAKIHSFGNKLLTTNHPDGRAVMYELATYSKRKILDLLSTLTAFEKGASIIAIFEGCQSKLLKKLTHCGEGYMFKDLTKTLQYFKDAFDQNQAKKDGNIVPKPGMDEEYDNINIEIKNINKELEEYLSEQRRFFGCQVNYFGSAKNRYQLEIPDNKCHKVNDDYQIEGKKKGFKRYSTPTTKELLAKMMKAESKRESIVKDLNRRVFEKFSQKHSEWEQVTHCYMMLDVLCALAEYARTYSEDICLPKVNDFSEKPILKMNNARHPCIYLDNFVPNDTELGTDEHSEILILTGPNMGGKSTLMRQTALIIIMAHIGSFVPAASCEMTAVDRIFTRLGASDDILKGKSTFLVEMSEASVILKHATKNSFLLIDELGRGTSTHDGNAIATAFVNELTKINCRTIFSTHYHTLVDHFVHTRSIQLGHMSCLVKNEGKEDEKVIFLYKLDKGVCPKSYGFNVAKLAGLPKDIIDEASDISKELQLVYENRQRMKRLFPSNDVNEIKNLIKELKV